MAANDSSLSVKLKAIDQISAPLKNLAGASGKVIESLKNTQQRLSQLNDQSSDFDAFRKLRKQSQQTNQALHVSQREVKAMALQFQASTGSVTKAKQAWQGAERHLKDLAAKMQATRQPSELLRHEFKQAQNAAKESAQAYKRATRDQDRLGRAFEQSRKKVNQLKQTQITETQQLQRMRQSLLRAGGASDSLSTQQQQLRAETQRLNQTLDAQAQKLKKIAEIEQEVSAAKDRMSKSLQTSAMMTVAGFGVQQAGQVLKNSLSGPIQAAAEFESKMSAVGAVSGATRADLKKLTDTARRLGSETAFSASEAAQGMNYLAMAGFKTEQMVDSMPGLLNLALSGDTDLATTSDIASDILSGFGLKADQMGRVGDVLSMTFTTANTNLTMLGETMKYVGPIAREAGMSLEETSAMAGLLGNVGIKSSQAGTTLRAMISRLAAPTGKASKMLEGLGISTKNASGDMRNIVDVLGDVAQATESMGSSDRLNVLKQVFGEEPAAGMAELISQQGAGGITKYLSVITESQGRAKQIADQMGDNAKGGLKALASAYESLQITLGNALLPIVRKVAAWLTNISRAAESFAASHPTMARGLALVASGLTALAVVGAPLLFAFASFSSILAVSQYAMTALSAAGRLASIRLGGLTAVTRIYNATNGSMQSGLTNLATNFFPGLKRRFVETIAKIKALNLASINLKTGGVSAISGFSLRSKAQLLTLKASMISIATGAIPALIAGIKAIGIAAISNPLGILIAAVSAVAFTVYKFWQPIKAFASGVFDGFSAAIAPLKQALSPLLDLLSPIGAVLGWIGKGVSWLISGFADLLTPVQATSENLEGLKAAGESAGKVLATAFEILLSPLTLVSKAIGLVSDAWQSLFGDDEKNTKTATIKQLNEIQSTPNNLAKKVAPAAKQSSLIAATALSASLAANPIGSPENQAPNTLLTTAPSQELVAPLPVPRPTPATAGIQVNIANISVQVAGTTDADVQAVGDQIARAIRKEVEKQLLQHKLEQSAMERGALYDH